MSTEAKDQEIKRLKEENQALRQKIAELERRLGLDSQTSSKPPSSDGLKKADPPKFIYLRIGNCPTSMITHLLRDSFDTIIQFESSETESLLVLL